MLHAKTALILMVAIALPSAAKSLGLGEIHVDSAINEPLAAEVDIVGASPEDLAGMTASVASDEIFLRFGFDRPAFLSTSTFRISMDGKGQPVLAIRSTDSFTEPLINMLIDLRWRSGELIREYTLLLDPPRFSPDTRFAEVVPTGSGAAYVGSAATGPIRETSQAASTTTPSAEQRPAVEPAVLPEAETVEVTAGATLRGIASHVSARAESGIDKMMIAIFRANPRAFEGNINRLRVGAMLTIPSSLDVSKISAADATHEIRLQMQAWRASAKLADLVKPVAVVVAAPGVVTYESAVAAEPTAVRQESTSKRPDGPTDAPDSTAQASDDAALGRRVQLLEQGLKELLGALDHEQQTLAGIQARVALADKMPAPAAKSGHAIGAFIAVVLVLASGVFGVLYARRRSQTLNAAVSPAESEAHGSGAPQIPALLPMSHEVAHAGSARNELRRDVQIGRAKDKAQRLVAEASAHKRTTLATSGLGGLKAESLDALHSSERSGGGLHRAVDLQTAGTADLASDLTNTRATDVNADTTPLKAMRAVPEASTLEHSAPMNATSADMSAADTAKLEYKVLNLDGAVYHVPMPSTPYEKAGFKERRTSLIDALKAAVKREPGRRDLRVKLLETYYAAAATSVQGFLEVAQSLASERANMTEGEWSKIAQMGRHLASDSDLFAPDFA